MPTVTVTGELTVTMDMSDLWDMSIQEYIECNNSLCDVEVIEVVET